jgi:hypothetical protein
MTYNTRLMQMEIARIIRKATTLITDAHEYTNWVRALSSMSSSLRELDDKLDYVCQYLEDFQEFQNRIDEGYLESVANATVASPSGQMEAYIFAHRMLNCASAAFQYAVLLVQSYINRVVLNAYNTELLTTCEKSFAILNKIMERSLADTEAECNNLIIR